MRIPIDNNTIGYVTQHPYVQDMLRCRFNRYDENLDSVDKAQITFGQFKSKYNTTHITTIIEDPNRIECNELRELAKNFKFPRHLVKL